LIGSFFFLSLSLSLSLLTGVVLLLAGIFQVKKY
jgi:hypothetical protein